MAQLFGYAQTVFVAQAHIKQHHTVLAPSKGCRNMLNLSTRFYDANVRLPDKPVGGFTVNRAEICFTVNNSCCN